MTLRSMSFVNLKIAVLDFVAAGGIPVTQIYRVQVARGLNWLMQSALAFLYA